MKTLNDFQASAIQTITLNQVQGGQENVCGWSQSSQCTENIAWASW